MTSKDASEIHPEFNIWYKHLILSSKPISLPDPIVDNTPPTVSISAPTGGATVSGTILPPAPPRNLELK